VTFLQEEEEEELKTFCRENWGKSGETSFLLEVSIIFFWKIQVAENFGNLELGCRWNSATSDSQ
jgi:hypothetical protein